MEPETPPQDSSPEPWYEPEEDPRPGDRGPKWAWLIWCVALAVLFYALGHAMVGHHFFTGGAQNNQNTGGPTGP